MSRLGEHQVPRPHRRDHVRDPDDRAVDHAEESQLPAHDRSDGPVGGYNQPDLHTRMFHYPARIHQTVRANLFKQSTAGYTQLKEALSQTFGI